MELDVIDLPADRVISKIAQISPKRRFGTEYHDAIEAAGNVRTYLHANVIEIETDDTASNVDAIKVTTFARNVFSLKAKQFVLATGGIENPRLLLLSNKVATNGLGNQNDLVGRFFMEHPRVHLGSLKPKDPNASFNLYDAQYNFFRSTFSGHLALKSKLIRQEKILNYKSWILGVIAVRNLEAAWR